MNLSVWVFIPCTGGFRGELFNQKLCGDSNATVELCASAMLRVLHEVLSILRQAGHSDICVALKWPQQCDYPRVLDDILTFRLSEVDVKECASVSYTHLTLPTIYSV